MILTNFVVFEGGDGSGTSTQLAKLKDRVMDTRVYPKIHFTFEPTDGQVGLLIRRALRTEVVIQPGTLAYLFAADRYEHLYSADGIIKRCQSGEIVISDRYILSSLVYQGMDCGDSLPERLNSEFPLPELLIYFDVEAAIATARFAERSSKDCYEALEFQKIIHKRYKMLLPDLKAAGTQVVIIDASQAIDIVSQEVWMAIKKLPILKQ